MWQLVFVGGIILFLVFKVYKKYDRIQGKICNYQVKPPSTENTIAESIDILLEMVRNNYSHTTWELSLLAGLIATIPIVYFLKQRLPTFFEWFVVAFLIFIVTYYSFSWIWAHFHYPNSRQIERNLLILKDRLSMN